MRRPPCKITATELSLLNELWQRTSATVLELTESLYGNTQSALLATVRKLLDRLEGKGCVCCDRNRWPYLYSASSKREDIADIRLQATADELCNGELAALLSCLIRSEKLGADDRANLRKVLNELDQEDAERTE